MRMVVVLPQPEGPKEHEELPVADGQVEVLDPDEGPPTLGDAP
jgi:hypothetical protein